MAALAALGAGLVFTVGLAVSVLTLIEKIRGFRRRDDRRDAQQEAVHAALERIAVAIEQLPKH